MQQENHEYLILEMYVITMAPFANLFIRDNYILIKGIRCLGSHYVNSVLRCLLHLDLSLFKKTSNIPCPQHMKRSSEVNDLQHEMC